MEVIEIPTTLLLEEMLKKLSLPSPKYEATMFGEAKMVTSVTFYPSADRLGSTYRYISLTGSPMDTVDAANNDAATRAIAYMERVERKVMKDYNYDRLLEKKLTERRHVDEVIRNNRKTSTIIREKDHKIKTMTKYWDNFIDNVSDTSKKIYEIAEEGYSVRSSELDCDINSTLWEVQKGTSHLNQLVAESTELLEQVGKYPYDMDSDCSEADQFPDHYPAPSKSPPQDIKRYFDDETMYDSDDLDLMGKLHL